MDEREDGLAVIEVRLRNRNVSVLTGEVALLAHFSNLKLERKRETRPKLAVKCYKNEMVVNALICIFMGEQLEGMAAECYCLE